MKFLTLLVIYLVFSNIAHAQKDNRGYIVKTGDKTPDIRSLTAHFRTSSSKAFQIPRLNPGT